MIKTKTMYECPGTGKLYDTREKALKAQRNYRAAIKRKEKEEKEKQELEECVNFVRLNARSPGEAWDIFVQRSLDIWGVRIISNISLQFNKSSYFNKFECRFNCWAEIADESKYDRYQKIFMRNRSCFQNDLDDFVNLTNKGFRFWGGGQIKKDNTYRQSASLELNIADFPVVKSNWEVVQDQRKLIQADKNHKSSLVYLFQGEMNKLREIDSLNKNIDQLNSILKELKRKQNDILGYNLNKFKILLEKSIPPVQVDQELIELFENVKFNDRN